MSEIHVPEPHEYLSTCPDCGGDMTIIGEFVDMSPTDIPGVVERVTCDGCAAKFNRYFQFTGWTKEGA